MLFRSRNPEPNPQPRTPDPHHPAPGAHHPHESPWVMVGPLVVLAILSVLGGYVMVPSWFPAGNQWLEHFLEPVFEHAAGGEAEHAGGVGLEIGLTAVSVLVALAGMGLAYLFYVARPQLPARLATRLQAVYNTLYNKYYVDEIYDAVVVRPIRRTSEAVLWRGIDVTAIDGVVNGLASWLQQGGDVLKRMQSGYTRAYGAWVLLGAFLVLLYFAAQY